MKRDIEASTTVRAPIDRAREVIVGDPGCVVAERSTADERQARRFHTTLAVESGAGGGLHQEVVVELGLSRSTDDSVSLPVRWHPAGHERMLPTFDGELEVSNEKAGTRVVLRGAYTVPLGLLGRLGDKVAGQRLAHQSLTAFVEQVARRLDAEVGRRTDSVGWHPAPYPVDLREVGPDNYIG